MIDSAVLTAAVFLSLLGALALWMRARRRKRHLYSLEALAQAEAQNLHIPQSLHPVIDTDVCIGSLSCLSACPEGDILGVVDGRAKLITAANCIGHGRCALECPVGAIKLVFGTAERGVDLPEVNEVFESSRRGVHVVGELGGMGLIKNAVVQGLQCAEHFHKSLTGKASEGVVDVAIVGSGPAGLATALSCAANGLSFRVLEQGTVGGTIAQYPRQKLVMTEPLEIPLIGKFGKNIISKEELLETWKKAIERGHLSVEEGVKVTGIDGQDGAFSVLTTKGPVPARKVVLATGRRGSPRKLGVPGEELGKVSYSLTDPEQYEGCKVLVVGGGDSALEAAISLCERSDAEVVLSYRGEAFGKCREANRSRVETLAQERRLKVLFKSQVKEIRPDAVVLDWDGKVGKLKNDYVLVSIGGELPLEFLKQAGVSLRRYRGEALGEPAKTTKARRGSAKKLSKEERKNRRFAFTLFTIGCLIIAGLAVVGWDYYRLPRPMRIHSPLHKMLRPAGVWGHGVGIVATLFMLSNFLYAVRKRWRRLKGASTIRRWLIFHQFVGFMSPLVIAFHAAFQSNNLLATGTAASLMIVVLTGLVGRFIYGLVPTQDGRTVELADLMSRWDRLKGRVEPLLEGVKNPESVRDVLALATAAPPQGSLVGLLATMPLQAARTRWRLRRLSPLFPSAHHHEDFVSSFVRLSRMRTQVGFYRSLKRLLSVWRVFHVVLAVALVFVIAAHIGVSLYLGYGWIFF